MGSGRFFFFFISPFCYDKATSVFAFPHHMKHDVLCSTLNQLNTEPLSATSMLLYIYKCKRPLPCSVCDEVTVVMRLSAGTEAGLTS